MIRRDRTHQDPPPAPKTPLKRSDGPARDRGHRENEYTLVFGSKGQGKSTFARAVVRARDRRGGSWIWYDGAGAHADLAPRNVVRSSSELVALIRRQLQAGEPVRAVLQLGWDADTSGVWRTIYGLGSVLLVLDEAQDVANAQRIHPELEQLVSKGRNRRVDILTTVRTPPELHGTLRGNADAVVSFRQASAHYADTLNRQHFHQPDGVELLLQLPQFAYLLARDGRVTRGQLRPPWRTP